MGSNEMREKFDFLLDFLVKHGYLEDLGDYVRITKKLEEASERVMQETVKDFKEFIDKWALRLAFHILEETGCGVVSKRELRDLGSFIGSTLIYQLKVKKLWGNVG